MFGLGRKKKKDMQEPGESLILWGPAAGTEHAEQEEREREKENPGMIDGIPVSPGALPGRGKIVTFHSPKGGDGVSTVAANVAALLARHAGTVLVDLNGVGAVRSRFGLPSDCPVNILDWESAEDRRHISVYEHQCGLALVPGVVHYDDLERVNPALVFRVLGILKDAYEYVVVDAPPVNGANPAWAAAVVSDRVFTVITPDRASIDMLGGTVNYLERLGCEDRSAVMLNKAGVPGGIRVADLVDKNPLGVEFKAILPYSDAVMEYNNRRQVVALARPKDPFSRAVSAFTEEVFD
ncbi:MULTISPECIES: AAA family ATPase [Desulfofundulus]|uniref:AAA domain-containing protein n=1 Tax=Desulfofundulus salinus TaxID=2419843 RepID=A0A494WU75_9FIRM|nr:MULTISPECIES: AAA family ATPase [Desulfofundulus]NHM26949.1 AAA family ATPase [Desulfofundulus sp. TPOSR]RKO66373.1 hypothetical protein D7024_05060 [Desulfofundulus salinum]